MILRLFLLLIGSYLIQAEVFSESPDIIGTKGMVIDAGSGGSRLHVFTWKPRVFSTIPPPITIPEANELWTGRMAPGIDSLASTPEMVASYLQPLIDFAKVTLGGYEDEFKNYPIYFKATGGMRELETNSRENLLRAIRAYLSDKTQCPFYFRSDFARVISGEEEAIFSWAATNFLMGTLLPDSQGLGSVSNVNVTYGTLDLGGASTQIAFYLPSQDIMEGLYNLQIGSQKHWNVYTKSFLQFGVVSARLRHMHDIADKVVVDHGLSVPGGEPATHSKLLLHSGHVNNASAGSVVTTVPTARPTARSTSSGSGSGSGSKHPTAQPTFGSLSASDPCFHSGYTETIQDSSGLYSVDISGPPLPQQDQLTQCMAKVKGLMELKFGKFCDEVFHGDCSIAGAYQPPIPALQQNNFIGQSTYIYPWKFFQLPPTASLEQFREKAENICALNFGDVLFYFESNNLGLDPDKLNIYLPYYCFLSSYILVLLHDGYRFPMNTTLTVLDQVNGHKVGWALGAILYEINELPWTLQLSTIESYPWGFVLVGSLLGFILGATAAVCIYREFIEKRKGARPSQMDDGYDERISRTSTLEMINGGGGGGSGGASPGGSGVGMSSGGATKRPSFGPPRSPSPHVVNRKTVGGGGGGGGGGASSSGIGSAGVAASFPSPYASPVKSGPPTQRGDSLLNMFRSNNVNRYEPVPDK